MGNYSVHITLLAEKYQCYVQTFAKIP